MAKRWQNRSNRPDGVIVVMVPIRYVHLCLTIPLLFQLIKEIYNHAFCSPCCFFLAPAFATLTTGRRTMAAAAASAPSNNSGVPDEYLDANGLIKSWKDADEMDTKVLKELIENQMIDGYTTKAVKDEYPRYKRFTNKCLGDKISNLRRSFRDSVERRADSKFPLFTLDNFSIFS